MNLLAVFLFESFFDVYSKLKKVENRVATVKDTDFLFVHGP